MKYIFINVKDILCTNVTPHIIALVLHLKGSSICDVCKLFSSLMGS